MIFYLGVHMPAWMSRLEVPMFVAQQRLKKYKRLPRARARWALDSGGFMEVTKRGGWTIDARTYAAQARRYRDEIGAMDWAAPQDWMCEPEALKATGLTVDEHQRRTVANFLELKSIAPDFPFIPVVQGFTVDEYRRCLDAYARAGVDLAREPIVGLGSVCRRQGTEDAVSIVFGVLRHAPGLRLHGFGFKIEGLDLARTALASADSMAWSYRGRRVKPGMPESDDHVHPRGAQSCANCIVFAQRWQAALMERKRRAVQPGLF